MRTLAQRSQVTGEGCATPIVMPIRGVPGLVTTFAKAHLAVAAAAAAATAAAEVPSFPASPPPAAQLLLALPPPPPPTATCRLREDSRAPGRRYWAAGRARPFATLSLTQRWCTRGVPVAMARTYPARRDAAGNETTTITSAALSSPLAFLRRRAEEAAAAAAATVAERAEAPEYSPAAAPELGAGPQAASHVLVLDGRGISSSTRPPPLIIISSS